MTQTHDCLRDRSAHPRSKRLRPTDVIASVRELADQFHAPWLKAYPFYASSFGLPGCDHLVPDDGEAGEAARRAELESILAHARRFEQQPLSDAEAVTLGCLIENVRQELGQLEARLIEHTVTPMPFSGPAVLLAIAARTVVADERAAADYIERLRRSGRWIDQQSERLRIGAAKGRLPVAPLVRHAIEWGEGVLAPAVPEALAIPRGSDGWDPGVAWREERDGVAATVVKPALSRWVEVLRDLLPVARSPDQPGLVYLPGGEADYANCVRSFTTLPLSPEEIHQVGLEELQRLETRALELGSSLQLDSLEAIHRALRASPEGRSPTDAMAAATGAIRRAEARTGEIVPEPLPPPCQVSPMPEVVASSGMAPHYTPPRLDGSRPGTFWFNATRPTTGAGWDLEAVAFHEGMPGHHLQLSRVQELRELTAMQRERALSVFAEGWALYAEQLAEEMGLYSDTESLLGALSASLARAARLVVDTGIHALGWTRQQALEFMVAHVPQPESFLANEIDRYIVFPGQALSYSTGKRELLRLRDEASRRLGPRFTLPEFHAKVLDSGSLPMPVLQETIRRWAGSA